MAFGERYARRASCMGLVLLALMVALAASGGSPGRVLFLAAVFACLPLFRRRRMLDEQRNNEVREDGRDRDLRLRADALAGGMLTAGLGAPALALCIPLARHALLGGELAPPGLLVLPAMAAALCAYAAEIAGDRVERT